MTEEAIRVTVKDEEVIAVYEAERPMETIVIAIGDIVRRKGAGTARFTMELTDD